MLSSMWSRPLSEQCSCLQLFLTQKYTKELCSLLPDIISQMFGVGVDNRKPTWNLFAKYDKNSADLECQVKLLHPDGPLFMTALHLSSECFHEFQLTELPSPLRLQLISLGVAPERGSDVSSWFVQHLRFVPGQPEMEPLLCCNIFEFLLLCILSYPLRFGGPGMPDATETSQTIYNVVFRTLLDVYVCRPVSKDTSSSLKRLSSTGLHLDSSRSTHLRYDVSDTCSSDAFLKMLSELWMCWGQTKTKNPVMTLSVLPMSQADYLPPPMLLLFLRCLLKHAHSLRLCGAEDSHDGDVAPVVSRQWQLVIRRLFHLLRFLFTNWPPDLSFQMALETWLTYIQPWRYIVKEVTNSIASPQQFDSKWYVFVQENFLFYNYLFVLALKRFCSMVLTGERSAHMLYRVVKVLSTPELAPLSRTVEGSLPPAVYADGCWESSLGDCYDGGGSRYDVAFLFSAPTLTLVENLVLKLRNSQHLCASSDAKQSAGDGWLLRKAENLYNDLSNIAVGDVSSSNISSTLGEEQSVACSYLQKSENILMEVFQPDLEDAAALGLYCQPMTRQHKSTNVTMKCHPEVQPVRSFEISFLVHFFYQLALLLSFTHQNLLTRCYNDTGVKGMVARALLLPPHSDIAYLSEAPNGPYVHLELSLRSYPRLSLRWLASKRTIVWLALLIVFVRCCTGLLLNILFFLPFGGLCFFLIHEYFEKKRKLISQ